MHDKYDQAMSNLLEVMSYDLKLELLALINYYLEATKNEKTGY